MNQEQVEKNNKSHQQIRETQDLSIYLDCVDGKNVFIKKAKTEIGEINNTREFNNQSFLKQTTNGKDVGFEFLKPTLKGKDLVYTDINTMADWLAKDNTPGSEIPDISQYIEPMLKFMRFCLEIPFAEIPDEIKKDGQKRMSKLMTNFNNDSGLLKDNGLIKESEIETLRKRIENGLDQRAFQHHDVTPWHMARKRNDGKLILVDSGWAGWSLKYYDAAYYILQMTGYAQQKEDALKFLDEAKEEFKDDLKFKETLATALSYRGIRLAAELYKDGKTTNGQEVLGVMFSEI